MHGGSRRGPASAGSGIARGADRGGESRRGRRAPGGARRRGGVRGTRPRRATPDGLRGPRRPHAEDSRLAATDRSTRGGSEMSDVLEDIDREVKANPVVVYMKGTPRFPMCGFSAATVEVLNEIGVPFKAVDVLAEADKRDAVKAYTSWPTIPQVFV